MAACRTASSRCVFVCRGPALVSVQCKTLHDRVASFSSILFVKQALVIHRCHNCHRKKCVSLCDASRLSVMLSSTTFCASCSSSAGMRHAWRSHVGFRTAPGSLRAAIQSARCDLPCLACRTWCAASRRSSKGNCAGTCTGVCLRASFRTACQILLVSLQNVILFQMIPVTVIQQLIPTHRPQSQLKLAAATHLPQLLLSRHSSR